MITIRTATPDDVGHILEFIRELARYEKAEHEVVATSEQLHTSLFGDSPSVFALLCLENDTPIGFALYFFNYSTWQAKPGLYLEDLYVTPSSRKCGAGRLLMQRLAQIALENGCGRFEWSVLDWNEPAINFYHSLKAKPQDEWIRYRLDGEALSAVAVGKPVISSTHPTGPEA